MFPNGVECMVSVNIVTVCVLQFINSRRWKYFTTPLLPRSALTTANITLFSPAFQKRILTQMERLVCYLHNVFFFSSFMHQSWNGFAFGRKNPDGSPDMLCKENYEIARLQTTRDHHLIIAALANGFPENFFVHCAVIDGQLSFFSRAADRGDGGDSEKDALRTLYSIHTKSLMAKLRDNLPPVVFALDMIMFGAEMPEVEHPFRLAAISMVECCELKDLPLQPTRYKRHILVHPEDPGPSTSIGSHHYRIIGHPHGVSMQDAITREIEFRSRVRVNAQIPLKLEQHSILDDLIKQRQQDLQDSKSVFLPLIFFWKNTFQVVLKTTNLGRDPVIEFSGRRHHKDLFQSHIHFWVRHFKGSTSLLKLDLFLSEKLFLRPNETWFGSHAGKQFKEFRERLHRVTAAELKPEELHEMTRGESHSRETRMEAVCRIAVHVFGCRVEGGFVRDWIVNGQRKHPSIPPRDWVHVTQEFRDANPRGVFPPPAHNGWMKWDFKPEVEVIPKDLDIELSVDEYFDVNRFISSVRELGIDVDYYQHIPQRHIFLFDRETGPFTADFIEPVRFSIVNILCSS
jgi:hypothetical protein